MRRALAIGLPRPGWPGRSPARRRSTRAYPVVAAMAYTPYAAVSSPAPVLVALALRRWIVAAVAAIVAAALALAGLPRSLAGRSRRRTARGSW